MNKYIELFANYLDEDDWSFSRIETDEVNGLGYLMTKYSGENCRMDVVFDADPEREQVMVFVYLPAITAESKRCEMAELVCRINRCMTIGSLELDMDNGEMRFKVTMDVEGGELTPTMIRNMRDSALATSDRYYPVLMALLYGDKSPKDALENSPSNIVRPADVSVQ